MNLLVMAVGLLLAATVALLAIELREHQRRVATWQTVELRFGRDLTPDALQAVLARVAGLPARAVAQLEARADHDGIRHFLATDQATLGTLRGGLSAALPGLRLLPVTEAETPSYRAALRLRLRGRLAALQTDGVEEVNAALLAALQPLGRGELLTLRWSLQPDRSRPVPPTREGQGVEPEERRRLRTKNEGNVLRAQAVLAARAKHPGRARHLLGRLTAVLRSRATAYGFINFSAANPRVLAPQPPRWMGGAGRYNANELAALLAWPVAGLSLPGVTLGTSPLLIPSARLPRTGRLLGVATWPGNERPVAQPVTGALSHSLLTGPTGVGKSTLLVQLALADAAAGRGLVLIDGSKGDTVTALLERLPERRLQDVIVLDCAAAGPQPGLNLFGHGDAELAADVVLGVLSDLFRDSWGPLSERYLRAGLVAVAHDEQATLADVPFVFSDAAYRRKLVGRLRDPLAQATFAAFESMSVAERQQQLAAPLNKLGTLLGRPIVRTVLGQARPQLDFVRALRTGQIVLISLAPARVGAPAARLIGALSIFSLFQAVQRRAELASTARAPFFVYIDEPRALGDLPMPLDALLEQARGLGVGLTLAPQSLGQLPKTVREAALTNVATRVVFQQNADDARLLARDLSGVTPDDLQDLAAYEAVARIGLGPGDLARPVTLKTKPLPPALRAAREVRTQAAQRWGVELQAIDDALQARHQHGTAAQPVGRKRRAAA